MPIVLPRWSCAIARFSISHGRSFGDRIAERVEPGGNRIVRVDCQADVMQQGGRQEFLVVGEFFTGQAKDLQTVIEHVSFRMSAAIALDMREGRK